MIATETEARAEEIFLRHLDAGCSGCPDCIRTTQQPAEQSHRSRILAANLIARDVRSKMIRYPLVCTYCGDIADHEDHLVPITWSGPHLRTMVGTVPSCADCNTRINDFPIPEISSRCEVALRSIEKKNAKLLKKAPIGSLNGVTGTLLKNALARRHQRATVIARLAVLRTGGFLALPILLRERIMNEGVVDLALER